MFDAINTDLAKVCSPEKTYEKHIQIATDSDNGVKYRAELSQPGKATIYVVDQGLRLRRPKDIDACDKLLLVELANNTQCAGYFIELKCGNMGKAIKQLHDTLQWSLEASNPLKRLKNRGARMVTNKMPANSGNSEYESARRSFRRDFGCELKRIKRDTWDRIDVG